MYWWGGIKAVCIYILGVITGFWLATSELTNK